MWYTRFFLLVSTWAALLSQVGLARVLIPEASALRISTSGRGSAWTRLCRCRARRVRSSGTCVWVVSRVWVCRGGTRRWSDRLFGSVVGLGEWWIFRCRGGKFDLSFAWRGRRLGICHLRLRSSQVRFDLVCNLLSSLSTATPHPKSQTSPA